MTIGERTSAPDAGRTEIERAIEELYAAGLELQASTDRRDVTPCMTAMVPGCLRRIADLMTDLRKVAECGSTGQGSPPRR